MPTPIIHVEPNTYSNNGRRTMNIEYHIIYLLLDHVEIGTSVKFQLPVQCLVLLELMEFMASGKTEWTVFCPLFKK